MTTPPPEEHIWWEVTLSTGLILRLPQPSLSIDVARALTAAKTSIQQRVVMGTSGGITYAVDLSDAVQVRVITLNPDRVRAALLRASQGTSSSSGQAAASPSDAPENPRGRSIGERTKRTTH